MNNNFKKHIEGLENTLTLFKDLRKETEKLYETYKYITPSAFNSDYLDMVINYYESVIDILKYYTGKLGNNDYLMLGKYVGIAFKFTGTDDLFGEEKLECKLHMVSKDILSKTFKTLPTAYVMNYSVFVNETLPKLLSLFICRENNSNFENFEDVMNILNSIKAPTLTKSGLEQKANLVMEQILSKGNENETKSAKNAIDWLFKISENEEITKDIDKLVEDTFDLLLKYAKKEEK